MDREEILSRSKEELIDYIIRNWDFNTIADCITKVYQEGFERTGPRFDAYKPQESKYDEDDESQEEFKYDENDQPSFPPSQTPKKTTPKKEMPSSSSSVPSCIPVFYNSKMDLMIVYHVRLNKFVVKDAPDTDCQYLLKNDAPKEEFKRLFDMLKTRVTAQRLNDLNEIFAQYNKTQVKGFTQVSKLGFPPKIKNRKAEILKNL